MGCPRRVGTGLNDIERRALHDRFVGNTVPYDRARKAPSCYRVTGQKKECPDVWIRDPFSSVVLQARSPATCRISACATATGC